MNKSRMESLPSVEDSRGERYRSHWTMKSDGSAVRSLKTQAMVHRAQDFSDEDVDDLPRYPSKFAV